MERAQAVGGIERGNALVQIEIGHIGGRGGCGARRPIVHSGFDGERLGQQSIVLDVLANQWVHSVGDEGFDGRLKLFQQLRQHDGQNGSAWRW